MKFPFNIGEQNVIPHTPAGDVKAGDFVDLLPAGAAGIKGGVATNDIKAGEEGVLDIGPMSFYWGKVGAATALGAPLYSDGTDVLKTTGTLFGYAAEAAAGAGTIRVQLDPVIKVNAVVPP